MCLLNASKVSFFVEGRWHRPLVCRDQGRVREWMSSVCGCAGGSVFGCGSDCGFFIKKKHSLTFFSLSLSLLLSEADEKHVFSDAMSRGIGRSVKTDVMGRG